MRINLNLRNLIGLTYCCAVSVLLTAGMIQRPVYAQQAVKLIELNGASVTTVDLDAEFERMPPENKTSILFRREQLGMMASSLMLRRELAKQAEQQGLANSETAQTALQLAKERVLSELFLAKFDETIALNPDALEQRARDIYIAEEKRFATPLKVRASHILIANGDGAKEKAETLLKQVRDGKKFDDLAKEASADPGSAANGGDLGYFAKGQMVKSFEDASFSMKTGEISDLIQTQFGYHIIKVTDIQPAGKQSFQEVREILIKEIKQKINVEGRTKMAEEIISRAKANPAALDAYRTQQGGKN